MDDPFRPFALLLLSLGNSLLFAKRQGFAIPQQGVSGGLVNRQYFFKDLL
jgi:hypothetical protein